MAYADAVKAGVGIDPDRRAYHMFIKSGLTEQINHIFGFAYESEAEGPGAALDPRKIQEAVLRFYDKPWYLDRHRDSRASLGQFSRPLMGGNKGSCTQEPWEEETFLTEDVYEYNDRDESCQQYPAQEYDDWEEEADLEYFHAGESDWIHQDVLDSDVLDSYVEEECSVDKSLYEAYLGYKEARDTLNQVRRGRRFWHVIAIFAPYGRSGHSVSKEETARTTPTRVRAKGARMEKVAKTREAKARVVSSPVRGEGDPVKQRLVSRTHCRLCVKKVTTGRKTVLKLLSTCLKPNAV